MRIKDNEGQVSLEYMLILTISLILLIVFTLPLTGLAVENTLDAADALAVKSDLSEIAGAVMQVYGEGQGSKQTITADLPKDIKVNIADNYISCNLKLNDGGFKLIKVNYKSTLPKTDIYLKKGENRIIVEWPADSKNMRIYTKLF